MLSGGEKARLALAKLLLRPSNVLILDEPTNHLDVVACEVLEDALRQYKGTLALISHDRAFINTLATRVVEVKDGVLREFPGNYDDYLRRLEGGPAAAEPSPEAAAATSPASPTQAKAPPRAISKQDRQRDRERKKARDRAERRVGRIEAEILEKETRVSELGWQLADPELFKDPDRLRAVEAERTAIGEEIAALYAEWERLGAEIASLADAEGGEAA